MMISTIRFALNAKLQACENILQNNHVVNRNGISENYSVRDPKCRLHDQHHKSS